MSNITPEAYQEILRRLAVNKARQGLTPADSGLNQGPEFESDLHEEIIAFCKSQSPQWIYIHSSMAHRSRQTLGTPDFIIFAPKGRVITCECKRRNGKESPAQLALRIRAEELGHEWHVVHSFKEFISIVFALNPLA